MTVHGEEEAVGGSGGGSGEHDRHDSEVAEATTSRSPMPKGILSETRRGAGSAASPYKEVKWPNQLPEGFPVREENNTNRARPRRRGDELSGVNVIILLLACTWMYRVLRLLTKTALSGLTNLSSEDFVDYDDGL